MSNESPVEGNSRIIAPEGLENDGRVIKEIALMEKIQFYIDKILALLKGGASASLANAADLAQGVDLIKPAKRIQTFSAKSSLAADTSTITDDATPETTDASDDTTPVVEEDYIWVPERKGNLWYSTRAGAGYRLSKLKKEGVCTDDTCRIEEFEPNYLWFKTGYRVAIRDFADGFGNDGITGSTTTTTDTTSTGGGETTTPKPELKGMEVHVNLKLPQQVQVFFEEPSKAEMIFPISGGEVTDELVDQTFKIWKRPNPELKVGKWGLQYFALFELNRGIGFHSNQANPRRRTLCDEGAEKYCEPAEEINERLKWGLVVDGTKRSHGCVRLDHENAITFYETVKNSTKVFVYDEETWRAPSWVKMEDV